MHRLLQKYHSLFNHILTELSMYLKTGQCKGYSINTHCLFNGIVTELARNFSHKPYIPVRDRLDLELDFARSMYKTALVSGSKSMPCIYKCINVLQTRVQRKTIRNKKESRKTCLFLSLFLTYNKLLTCPKNGHMEHF
jgi:hypothetical protein